MPKLKENTIIPTDMEDIAINQGIKKDKDTYELSSVEFKKIKHVGRPKADTVKKATTLRLDADIYNYLTATGRGWQTKINAILRQSLSKELDIQKGNEVGIVRENVMVTTGYQTLKSTLPNKQRKNAHRGRLLAAQLANTNTHTGTSTVKSLAEQMQKTNKSLIARKKGV
jgi:uncharacterized protein (DUF4415 family)